MSDYLSRDDLLALDVAAEEAERLADLLTMVREGTDA
jgi:hypothetical protein